MPDPLDTALADLARAPCPLTWDDVAERLEPNAASGDEEDRSLPAGRGGRPPADRRWLSRRQLVGAAAAVVVAGLAAVLVTWWPESDEPVHTGPAPATESTTTTETIGDGDLRLVPSGPLQPGATVTLELVPPVLDGTEVVVVQCVREVLDVPPAFTSDWCDSSTPRPPRTLTAPDLSLVVARVIPIPQVGRVDCADEPGRCVLGVRIGGAQGADDRVVPLVFATDLPPVVAPTARLGAVPAGGIPDGTTVTVTVSDLQPGEEFGVLQCAPEVPAGPGPCDVDLTGPAEGVAGPDGTATIEVPVYHDIFLGYRGPGWVACDPCTLEVQPTWSEPPDPLPIAMAPTAAPQRPEISIEPPGPHPPGSTVTILGSGLRLDDVVVVAPDWTEPALGWCRAERPGEVGSWPACVVPSDPGITVEVDPTGALRVEGFPLPGPDVVVGAHGSFAGVRCAESPGACVIGWQPADGSDYVVALPLDLSG